MAWSSLDAQLFPAYLQFPRQSLPCILHQGSDQACWRTAADILGRAIRATGRLAGAESATS